jgi:hypothetical protein
MVPRIEQFILEREYLSNVSPFTVSWHTHSLKWLPCESPTDDDLTQVVLRMREKGLRATGCNSAIRSINAYLHWNNSGFMTIRSRSSCLLFCVRSLRSSPFTSRSDMNGKPG